MRGHLGTTGPERGFLLGNSNAAIHQESQPTQQQVGQADHEVDAVVVRPRLAQRVVVVTTLVGAISRIFAPQEGDRTEEIRATLTHNLELLHKHGVLLAMGSDSYSHTAQAEALALKQLGVFDTLTLLKMWCETTPAAILPNRKLGALREGYEASFLVLPGNPLDDFSHVTRIEARVKQGVVLSAAI